MFDNFVSIRNTCPSMLKGFLISNFEMEGRLLARVSAFGGIDGSERHVLALFCDDGRSSTLKLKIFAMRFFATVKRVLSDAFTKFMRYLRKDPLGIPSCWVMVAVIVFAAIISSKKIGSREICEVIGIALVFCGTIWTAFGVNIDPEETVHVNEHITDFENRAKQENNLSMEEIAKELRNLDKTCAELSKALLNASRFSFQGSIQIIFGTLFLLYPFISYLAK
jgi:hypothetical protein